jgi:hypothetical protein
MARLRFSTAREVFETFPSALEDITAGPSDEAPFPFARGLLGSDTPEDAIAFCAYLLPRREAVWWACQTLRAVNATPGSQELSAIEAAETWVREPEEHRRRAALRIGMSTDRRLAATWAALAAAWSGGSMSEGEHMVPVPPDLTAKAARVAVLTGLSRVGAKERAGHLRTCLENGLRLVADEPDGAG